MLAMTNTARLVARNKKMRMLQQTPG